MKQTFLAAATLLFLCSCTAFKQIGSGSNKSAAQAQPNQSGELKFLNINVDVEKPVVKNTRQPAQAAQEGAAETSAAFKYTDNSADEAEGALMLQTKYAALLNTEVNEVRNLRIFEYIDEWYGTRYCMGGTTKSCIDCSAFVQLFFTAIYGATIPRTAREQYRASKKISRTEIKEGDLLFFNTRGGISHVGIYLQNNKFVHASTSGGVMISDMFEPYWIKRFIGVGRIDKEILAGTQ